MPDRPATGAHLRAALHGVRGLVLDADGVLVRKGSPIPGAPEALRELERRDVPFRIVTNFSRSHRDTLAAGFSATGVTVAPDRIVTAASAAAALTGREHPGQPLYVLATPDALREFEGQRVVGHAEAAAPAASVGAVVIGDAGDDLSFANLDAAFRLVRGGAALVAMHRNPWWLTPRGPTLDSGALVTGLEWALGTRARIAGKPSPVVFREAAAGLARDLGLRRPPWRDLLMVGDDLDADLAPAARLGMRTSLVLTGKVEPGAEGPLLARARRPPDAVAPSLRELVRALG